jgi:outer membrane protein, multidrug efflux system
MNRNLFLLLGLIFFLLEGCTLAPTYTRPEAPVPAQWPAGASYRETKPDTGGPKASELPWREFFTDPRLQKIIETALNNNRDLRLAVLNVERAQAVYGVARTGLFPSVYGTGYKSKIRTPADLSSTGNASTATQYSVNLGITSWEIDFFGRISSLKDFALEQYLATDEARRSAQILLVSSVANAYLALASDRESLKLATSTLEAQEDSYGLIRKRYDTGLTSQLDLSRVQSQVETARVDVARYTQFTAQDENALNLLAGAPVPQVLLPPGFVGFIPPREISAGLSSELLLGRPDVIATEHLLKAANANIGAARAAFFPRISLTATLGTASAELSGLFRNGQETLSFIPLVTVPIFDARTWYAYDVTKKEWDISVAQYEKAIQVAFREVADALAVQGTVAKQIAAQQSLVDAVSDVYRLSMARYTKGIDSYLGVLDAQRSLYSAQQGLIVLRLAWLTNRMTLYKVLGGGA